MKMIVRNLAVVTALVISCNAAQAGVVHRLAQVAGTPLWLVGWSAACVSGAVVIPVNRGFKYFCQRPFIKL